MFFTTTFFTLLLAALTNAAAIFPRDDDLVTFCFSENSCFQASVLPDAGCTDLPLFSESFATASLSAPGLECILSPDRGCLGNTGLTGILSNSAGTVELSALGLTNVASFLCTPDVDLINLCFPTVTEGCYQATTITDGCANLPRISEPFVSASLTTSGTNCTLFEDADCAGASTVVAEALVTVDLGPLGLSNVGSISCLDT
ncbi:hypothetical protein B0H17DRAFT_1040722 [Mycena rosella]|uniref:Uncharacterized protein n=1 Tax=Mycena rosella TaxID=1033263 RepID=A0AAD7GQK9_MYCRO|nr:hypothetical protein B0H17DRAFT_1040722 [Mycena rosella]